MSLVIWLKPPQMGKGFVTTNSKHTTLDCSNGGRPSTHSLYIAVFSCLQDTTLLLAWVFELDQLQFKTWKCLLAAATMTACYCCINLSFKRQNLKTKDELGEMAAFGQVLCLVAWFTIQIGFVRTWGPATLPIGFDVFFLGGRGRVYTYIYIYNSPSSDKLRLIVGDFWR